MGRLAPLPLSLETERQIILIERAVRRVTADRVRDLDVFITSDGVQLFGHCATYHCKQLAQTAAKTVVPNQKIQNHIEVW